MTDVRAAIVSWAKWGVDHHGQMNYQEVRPMNLSANLPWTGDCSSFVTLCYWLAGAPDPNEMGYDGYGYTGTLLQHGQMISLDKVLPGDVVVYGPGTGWHTALIVEAGPDPLTVSMGEQGDPNYCRVSQDGRLPQTYLRFATNSRFPAPPVVHTLPKASGAPTPAQMALHHKTLIRNGIVARRVLRRHWRLWYWSKDHFVAQVGGEPRGVVLYVDSSFFKKKG